MARWVASNTRHHVTSLYICHLAYRTRPPAANSKGEQFSLFFWGEISPCPFYQTHSGHMGISGQITITAV